MTQRNFRFRCSAITSFNLFHFRTISLRICSRNDIPSMDLSTASLSLSLYIYIYVCVWRERERQTDRQSRKERQGFFFFSPFLLYFRMIYLRVLLYDSVLTDTNFFIGPLSSYLIPLKSPSPFIMDSAKLKRILRIDPYFGKLMLPPDKIWLSSVLVIW